MKKTLAILLSLALVICMFPSVAFAEATALDASTVVVTLDKTSANYTGGEVTVPVTVKVDGTAIASTEYTVETTPSTVQNAGDYTVKVKATAGSEVLSGEVTLTDKFTVNQTSVGNTIVTASNLINSTDFDYNTEKKVWELNTAGKGKISVTLDKKDVKSQVTVEGTATGTATSCTATKATITISADGTSGNFSKSTKTIDVDVYNSLAGYTAQLTSTAAGKLTYTGSALTPSIVVKKDNATLSSANYTLKYYTSADYESGEVKEIKNIGTYYVKVVGNGTYSGELKDVVVEVVGKSIANVYVTANTAAGTDFPVLVVKDGSTVLVENVDYEFVGSAPTITKEPTSTANGTGKVTIQGKGNYSGTKADITYTVTLAENKIDASSIVIGSNVETFSVDGKIYTETGFFYNGTVQTPKLVVKSAGGKTLSTGDYTVEYIYTDAQGKEVSTTAPKDYHVYTVVVTGRGNYSGSATAPSKFIINQYPVQYATVTASQASATSTPSVTVRTADGKATFVATTDYTASTPVVLQSSGTAVLTITGTGKGNLSSGTKTVTYAIVAKSIASCSVTADSSANYTGYAITPTVNVYDGATRLIAGSAYTITYKDAAGNTVSSIKDAGTYTIVITGVNGYGGSVSKTFVVNGNDISGAVIALNATTIMATGNNVSLPAIQSVKIGTSFLSAANYNLSYEDSTGKTITAASAPGIYYVVITGTGAYTGKAKAAFEIKGTDQVISVTSASLVKTYRNSDEFALGAACSTSKLTYTSSDSAIASVTSDGIVTPMGKAGTATITISAPAAGKYNAASATVTVVARPYKAKVTSVSSPAAGSLKAYVAKQSGCTGYQVVISKSSSFKKGTRFFKKIANNPKYTSSQSTTYTGLKAGKYYVKARAMYIGADGTVAYGNYGAVQTVTVK